MQHEILLDPETGKKKTFVGKLVNSECWSIVKQYCANASFKNCILGSNQSVLR